MRVASTVKGLACGARRWPAPGSRSPPAACAASLDAARAKAAGTAKSAEVRRHAARLRRRRPSRTRTSVLDPLLR